MLTQEYYKHNANGNLTKDFYKNISSIQYNHLNLPSELTFEDGKRISDVYDVSGVKHEVKRYNPSVNPSWQTTKYIGNKIYEEGVLSKVLTEDGYLEKQGTTYSPFYYVKDHLGSNRVVLNEKGEVVQSTNYYPFGMSFAELQPKNDQDKQHYKYNGKELDKSHGVNMYEYGASMYDPAIGRFSTIDPMAEKYYSMSPYCYAGNNPVNFIDLRGDSISVAAEHRDQFMSDIRRVYGDKADALSFNASGNLILNGKTKDFTKEYFKHKFQRSTN